MIVVYSPGVWDLFHVGHLTFLENAASFGDTLVVGVPSDEAVIEDKGSPPIIPLEQRMRILSGLACVDCVVPYHKLEFRSHLNMIRPDVMVVGEQWGSANRHKEAEQWVKDNNRRLIKLPYHKGVSTTSIINKVRGVKTIERGARL